MLYSLVDGERRLAEPGLRGVCSCCNAATIAKCGSIKVWHWSHESLEECDPWWEPEGEWHVGWKMKFPESFREVVIGNHRADIRGDSGFVIELQHSSISAETIAERENFYRNMLWLFDGRDIAQNFDFRFHSNGSSKYHSFRWKWPRKSWITCTKPVFIQIDQFLVLEVKKVYPSERCGGWGHLIHTNIFQEIASRRLAKEKSALRMPVLTREAPILNDKVYVDSF